MVCSTIRYNNVDLYILVLLHPGVHECLSVPNDFPAQSDTIGVIRRVSCLLVSEYGFFLYYSVECYI